MRSRAGIVVTGTEVLTGRVADRNGPWLVERLRERGVDIAQVIVVGDRPDDLRAALAFFAAAGVQLVITTGGLGPTADDLTADVVAAHQGRPVSVDPGLESRIGAIVERLARGRGWRMDPAATAAGVRKQAQVPAGAVVLEPVGTAPGLVVPVADGTTGPPVLVLPGPPRELQGMWPAALASEIVDTALGAPVELRERTIRMWGVPESELAATLRAHEHLLTGLEVTTCLRDWELEIVTRYGPDREDAYQAVAAAIGAVHGRSVYSPDGRTVDRMVADDLVRRGLTIATAESCTAGLLAGRLTELAGSSAYVRGGLVVYSNAAKTALAAVPAELIERVGAVSEEVARALADGARRALEADVGVGITGVAGPGGGTAAKPVGLVHLCVSDAERAVARRVELPGTRGGVRHRSVVLAMHMVRELLG